MALKSVSKPSVTKDAVKLTELPVGGSVEGYPIAFVESKNYPGTYSIVMQDKDGERFYVNTAGNVKYAITDERIQLNLLTRIVRNADQKMKNGKMTSNFDILQDDEDSIVGSDAASEASFNALGGAPAPGDIRNSNTTKAAVERASVKATAKSLTAQVAGQRK